MYLLQIILQLRSVEMENFKLSLLTVIIVKNRPMMLHKSTESLFELDIDHDFLQSRDDLIKFYVLRSLQIVYLVSMLL